MYEIILLNKNGERFAKTFNSEYMYNKYLNKAKYSKTLTILSYGKIQEGYMKLNLDEEFEKRKKAKKYESLKKWREKNPEKYKEIQH